MAYNYKQKNCVVCGRKFPPNTGSQIYCDVCGPDAKKSNGKQYYADHREEKKAAEKQRRESLYKKTDVIFGIDCFLCGAPPKNGRRHPLHNKLGEDHKGIHAAKLALENPSQFVRLCYPRCHIHIVHGLMRLGFTWDEINAFVFRNKP